jgi:hypothetical protein
VRSMTGGSWSMPQPARTHDLRRVNVGRGVRNLRRWHTHGSTGRGAKVLHRCGGPPRSGDTPADTCVACRHRRACPAL